MPYPPVMYLYSLNGKLEMFYAFYEPWKDDDILRAPKKLDELRNIAGDEELKVPQP